MSTFVTVSGDQTSVTVLVADIVAVAQETQHVLVYLRSGAVLTIVIAHRTPEERMEVYKGIQIAMGVEASS